MPFSAGNVISAPRSPQSGQPGRSDAYFDVNPRRTGMSDAVVSVRDQSEGMGNPYGIPGSQGPAINIRRAAQAIRGREAPAVVQIERRVDPQYSNRDLGWSPHERQEQVPGKEQPVGLIRTNTFRLPGRERYHDPESLARSGSGASRYAGGQESGVGMQDTTRSSQLLNESPAPTRIPRLWNDGLNAAAGLVQYAFTQQNYSVFIKHPWLGRVPQPTRGIRAISGVTAQASTSSRIRIPAIFVPSAVG
jgi:hypothetical protein